MWNGLAVCASCIYTKLVLAVPSARPRGLWVAAARCSSRRYVRRRRRSSTLEGEGTSTCCRYGAKWPPRCRTRPMVRRFIRSFSFSRSLQKRTSLSDSRRSPRARAATNPSKWAITPYYSARPPVIRRRPSTGFGKTCGSTWIRTPDTQFSTKDSQVFIYIYVWVFA